CLGTDERQKQRFAKCDVEARERQKDEAACRHPMNETLETVEAFDPATGTATLDHHHAPHEIEDDDNCEHAEHGDGADPTQGDFMEMTPLTSSRLFEHVRLYVWNSAAPLNSAQFLEQLLLLHGHSGRIDRSATLLCGRRRRHGNKNRKCQRANNEAD